MVNAISNQAISANATDAVRASRHGQASQIPETDDMQNKVKKELTIPIQEWRDRVGKGTNVLKHRVSYTVDPKNGNVVIEPNPVVGKVDLPSFGKNSGNFSNNPVNISKGALFNDVG